MSSLVAHSWADSILAKVNCRRAAILDIGVAVDQWLCIKWPQRANQPAFCGYDHIGEAPRHHLSTNSCVLPRWTPQCIPCFVCAQAVLRVTLCLLQRQQQANHDVLNDDVMFITDGLKEISTNQPGTVLESALKALRLFSSEEQREQMLEVQNPRASDLCVLLPATCCRQLVHLFGFVHHGSHAALRAGRCVLGSAHICD